MEPAEALYDIHVVKNVLIPMSDGVALAADLVMPDAQQMPTLQAKAEASAETRHELPSAASAVTASTDIRVMMVNSS